MQAHPLRRQIEDAFRKKLFLLVDSFLASPDYSTWGQINEAICCFKMAIRRLSDNDLGIIDKQPLLPAGIPKPISAVEFVERTGVHRLQAAGTKYRTSVPSRRNGAKAR
jgi:hypothetical protein